MNVWRAFSLILSALKFIWFKSKSKILCDYHKVDYDNEEDYDDNDDGRFFVHHNRQSMKCW